MLSRLKLIVGIGVLFVLIYLFFSTNGSYKESFEARFYYAIDEFEKAHELAQSAYEKDPYNKMAFTVLVQSAISKEYVNYINEGAQYFDKITDISSKSNITSADLARIKMICEVMIESHKSLRSSKLTSKELQLEADDTLGRYETLYSELFK